MFRHLIVRNGQISRTKGFELIFKSRNKRLAFRVLFYRGTIHESGIPVNFRGSMDVDFNRPASPTKIYEVAEPRFHGVSPIQMIADKTAAVSTDKVFRRIKDVIDLYYLSNVFDFNRSDVLRTIENSGRTLTGQDIIQRDRRVSERDRLSPKKIIAGTRRFRRFIGVTGFEPATSRPPAVRSNQTEPYPDTYLFYTHSDKICNKNC